MYMRFAMVQALLAAAALAQVVPTEADRVFADQLIALPDEQAHTAIASAAPDRITEGLAAALNNAGVSIYNRHDTTGSLRVYRLAIDAAERGGFKIIEAKARSNVSIDLTRMGELEDALQQVNRAVDLYRGANVPSSFANILSTRAVTYKDLGEFDQAREDYQQAEQIFRQVGDEVGLARVLNGEGQLLLDSGDYRGALSALEKSLALAQRHDQNLGEAFVLNNMAAVYSAQGNFTLAISLASRSLKIKQASGSKEDTGTSLISLGVIYHKGGRDNEAIASFESAVQLGRETGRKIVTAEALRELGTLELHRKHYAASLEYLESCLQMYKESGSAVYEERALARIAQVYLLQGDYSHAAEVAERSLALARDHGAMPDLFIPGVVAGKSYRALGRNREARRALEDAVAAAEEGRDRVAGDEQSRQKFFAERLEPYHDLIALDLAEGQQEAAFRMSERAKSRVLLDLVAPGRTGVDRILTAPERIKEADLHRRLSLARAQLATLSKTPAGSADRVRITKEKIESAQTELASFRSVLYSAHPELSARRGDVSPVTLAQAEELLPDSESAILDYVLTKENAYLFVITKSSGGPAIHVHKLAIDGARLELMATEFRAKLASRDPGFATIAERLYRNLLSPARTELAGKKLLIVAPDADLWQIPLAALRSPSGRYLLEDAAIVYTPSLSVLHTLRAVKRAPAHGKPTFAAFGDPDGDNPNANREVKTLAQLYGADANATWTGAQASVPNFRARAGSFEVVHVATHGVFDDEDPLRSHLILHKSEDDGHIEAADIQDLQLKARLVVLSGCETARGRFAEGEGAIGMSWAFLAAGSRAVVASQWRVESSSTTELMLQFHESLLAGQGDAQALRHAALGLMKTERFRHPFYWAGFAVFGDGY
jgi:CHAT domain-containing protein/tetratricopeptide (TPR) repeat protein